MQSKQSYGICWSTPFQFEEQCHNSNTMTLFRSLRNRWERQVQMLQSVGVFCHAASFPSYGLAKHQWEEWVLVKILWAYVLLYRMSSECDIVSALSIKFHSFKCREGMLQIVFLRFSSLWLGVIYCFYKNINFAVCMTEMDQRKMLLCFWSGLIAGWHSCTRSH